MYAHWNPGKLSITRTDFNDLIIRAFDNLKYFPVEVQQCCIRSRIYPRMFSQKRQLKLSIVNCIKLCLLSIVFCFRNNLLFSRIHFSQKRQLHHPPPNRNHHQPPKSQTLLAEVGLCLDPNQLRPKGQSL